MSKILVIGDSHGYLQRYWEIIQREKPERSIQLGDFGFKRHHDWFLNHMDTGKHKVLFGNHDYYPYLDKPHSLGDFYKEVLPNGRRLMCIRGAWSIDQYHRTEGLDWFREEEMSMVRWNECINEYEKFKPHIVLSHDAPYSINKYFYDIYKPNRTSTGLQSLLDIHTPLQWVFGHHHKPRTEGVNGCHFTCLGELQFMNI